MQLFEPGPRLCLGATAVLVFALAAASEASADGTVYALADEVVVYQSPSTKAPEIARLSVGSAVVAHGARGNWQNVDVELDGRSVSGWVKKGEVGADPPGLPN